MKVRFIDMSLLSEGTLSKAISTYKKGGLGTTKVRGLDIEGSSGLPLGLGLLHLAGEASLDL